MAVEREPLMGLPIITPSTSKTKGTYGQDWALYLNEVLQIFDAHDHSPTSGVKIASENLTAGNLDLKQFDILNISYADFVPANQLINNSFYISGTDGDLYYQDGQGRTIRFTQGGAIAAGSSTIGGFDGDFVSANALATFSGEQGLFSFYGSNAADNAEVIAAHMTVNGTLSVFNGTFEAHVIGESFLYFNQYKSKMPVNTTTGGGASLQYYAAAARPIAPYNSSEVQIWQRNNQGGIEVNGDIDLPTRDIAGYKGRKYWIQKKNSPGAPGVNKSYAMRLERINSDTFVIPRGVTTINYPYVVLNGAKLVNAKIITTRNTSTPLYSFGGFIGYTLRIDNGTLILRVQQDLTDNGVPVSSVPFEVNILWMIPMDEPL